MDYLEAVTSAAGFFMVIFKFIFKLEHIVNLHLNFDSVSMQKKKKSISTRMFSRLCNLFLLLP